MPYAPDYKKRNKMMIKRRKPKVIRITEDQYNRIKAHLKYIKDNYYCVKNAVSDDEGCDMIKYWEEKTGIDLNGITYICPHCQKPMRRDQLDGSHVVIDKCEKGPQYIIPLCQAFNRSRDKYTTFYVPKELLVPAP